MSAHEGSAAQAQWDEKELARLRDVAKGRQLGGGLVSEQAQKAASEQLLEKDEKSDPLNDELQAMRSVARTLEKLPRDAQERVIAWLANRQPPRLGYGYNEMAKVAEGPRR